VPSDHAEVTLKNVRVPVDSIMGEELQTECEMTRNLVYKTAWRLDHHHHMEISDQVSICNYRANPLVCNAADLAIQVHGGIGYPRHQPFEHIYRHHRRYRITEGSEEIQIRRVAQILFAFSRRPKGAPTGAEQARVAD
jgi:alkylation response protein AidB-like acyl-CoA dehydrogenase